MTDFTKVEPSATKPVAIVGIATQFPSGHNGNTNLSHEAFFQSLLHKWDVYEKIPSDRFNIASWKGQGLGQVVTDTGGFLKDISLFDYLEFGITRQDAKCMALSTRKLIEISFLALLDSGLDYRGKNVGCFMSGVPFDILTIADPDEFDARGSFAGASCMIANRVSYHLDLLGPSVPTDTACSSSLSALHLAVQALRGGDCESAVVGACQVNHRFVDWILYSQGSILSPDGKCKPFDASADGFSRGEGVAAVVVKLLEHALRDGDHIYGTVLGTGINTNGSAAPVSAPLADGQADAMHRAFKGTARRPAEVSFVELHATGTAAGDPVEANWIGENFKRDGELLIGSVKGNIGHTEVAAFLASLSKVCSIFKYGVIPPNVHLTTPNPSIKWNEYRLRVPLEATPLPSGGHSKLPLISICSSGIGGANGHAVVEGPPPSSPYQKKEPDTPVLLLSGGLTPRSAAAVSEDLDDLATRSSDILAISTIYGRRIRQMTWRSYSIRMPDGTSIADFLQPVLAPRTTSPLVFVMTGQGPQHIHMGRQLFETYPAFRESILALDKIYEGVTGHSLVATTGIFAPATPSTPPPGDLPVSTVPPVLSMVQIALIDLLRSVGITPDAVVGHSAGEAATLYACGASSRAAALEISIARGLAVSLAAGGTMAAVACTAAEVEDVILKAAGPESEGKLEIACFNAHNAVALSGLEVYIDKAVEIAKERGFIASRIRTPVPAHSSLMEPCRSEYLNLIGAVFARHPGHHFPQIPTFSGWTGAQWEDPFTADYFWKNTRRPVRFEQAITSVLHSFPTANFIEISPHPTLSSYVAAACARTSAVVCPMRRSKEIKPFDEACNFLKTLGRLATLGYNSLDVAPLTGCFFSNRPDLRIPEYPFAPKEVPYYPEFSRTVERQLAVSNGPLSRKGLRMNAQTHPDLAQHVIRGEPIMPAAGYLEVAFELGARVLRQVNFRSMMPFPPDKVLHVDVEADEHTWSVSSRLPGLPNEQSKRLHADGYISRDLPQGQFDDLDIGAIKTRCLPFKASSNFYETVDYFAQYGPLFRRITACYKGDNETLVQVRGRDVDVPNSRVYVLHPAILDACVHVMVHPAFTGDADRNIYYLPSRIESVVLHTPLGTLQETLYCQTTFRQWKPDCFTVDFIVTDQAGKRLCTLSGFELARHEMVITPPTPSNRYDITLEPTDMCVNDLESLIEGSQSTDITAPPILSFKVGEEMKLQRYLRNLDLDKTKLIWIEATSALDAAAARGFSRSLRKELFGVRTHLVTFDPVWTKNARSAILEQLATMEALEEECHVDGTGKILVPRLVPLPPPSAEALTRNAHWASDGVTISHPPEPYPSARDVVVQVTSCSSESGQTWGFAGHVVAVGAASTTWPLGTSVVGATHGMLSNFVIVDERSICRVDDIQRAADLSSIVIPITILSLAIGSSAVDQPWCLDDRCVLVTNSDTPIGQSLLWLLGVLGIRSNSIPSTIHLDDLASITTGDIAISGFVSDADTKFIRGVTSSRRVTLWNDAGSEVFQAIRGEPWRVNDAIQRILPKLPKLPPSIASQAVEPSRRLLPGLPETFPALFQPQKVYMLLGGIGSLGIRCALWMYENGARKIVLTSRSGRETLVRTQEVMANRILIYLESLPDLQVTFERCDSTSPSGMAALFQSTSGPIGGIILLSAVLSDRLFVEAHTAESYDKAVAPKKGTFEALRSTFPIERLDFLVSLSSMSTFGSAGQTNYASANCLVDEMLRPYSNAFSLLAPAICDTVTIASSEDLSANARLAHLVSWAMSSRQILNCLGDGIRMLKHQVFGLYIPDLNWYCMERDTGISMLYHHLVEVRDVDLAPTNQDSTVSLQTLALRFLDVNPADFSPEVPFTAYGLDSLSAGRLAFALKPYISITQVQLLADISLDDLLLRIENSQSAKADGE